MEKYLYTDIELGPTKAKIPKTSDNIANTKFSIAMWIKFKDRWRIVESRSILTPNFSESLVAVFYNQTAT